LLTGKITSVGMNFSHRKIIVGISKVHEQPNNSPKKGRSET
jgi:hypothetical protein